VAGGGGEGGGEGTRPAPRLGVSAQLTSPKPGAFATHKLWELRAQWSLLDSSVPLKMCH
jgi:hypothetical protein